MNIEWKWEKKLVADRVTPQHFENVTWDRLYLTVGEVELFVQVPPYPAKLYLRNIRIL
jgi:hypothetical protein